jgi:hypothetical protein
MTHRAWMIVIQTMGVIGFAVAVAALTLLLQGRAFVIPTGCNLYAEDQVLTPRTDDYILVLRCEHQVPIKVLPPTPGADPRP